MGQDDNGIEWSEEWPKEKKKRAATFVLCFFTALLAGLTVWSINGSITYYTNTYYGDTKVTTTVDPVIQGALAFTTILFLLISVTLLLSCSRDKLLAELQRRP